jgi:hypothetical protein
MLVAAYSYEFAFRAREAHAIWQPTGATYTQPTQDVVYHISVTGITGAGATTSVAYDVKVVDPYDAIFANGFED